ncbi:MAG: sigma-70 family RNA polymerase sigma factor [Fibrobacterota bacterium]|nr:sigma-70 family RNA polymerase sigma factor [Fibrobacterota bacterium]
MINTTLLNPTETKTLATVNKTLDHNAFQNMYETYYQLVHRVCYRYTKNREEADDLAQEIFLKVHGRFTGFEGNSQPSTWLFRVATNHCLDHLRWKKRQTELLAGYGDDLAFSRAPEASADNPAKRLFSRLLETMDAANRQVVFLRFEVGLTHEEIAEICGVSRVAITKRLAKFQTKVALLKVELSDSLEDVRCDTGYARVTAEDCDDA